MGVETAIIVGGAAVSAYGASQESKAQERAARANAASYAEQRRMQQVATRKELDNFERESDQFLGETISLFSRAGVDFSGSALMKFVENQVNVESDKAAIKLTGQNNSRLFELRERQALQEARDIRSARGVQTLGSILNVTGVGMDANRKYGKKSTGGSPSGTSITGP
jgi:hypothetical protein